MRTIEIRYCYEFVAQGEADFDVEAWNRFEEIFRRKIPQKMPVSFVEPIVGDAAPGVPQIRKTYDEQIVGADIIRPPQTTSFQIRPAKTDTTIMHYAL